MPDIVPFPPAVRPFRLRSDLADELCIFDGVRAPLRRTEIDDFLGKVGVTRIGLALVHVINEHCRAYVPRRFICYYTGISAGSTKPTLRAYDGLKLGALPIAQSALFEDALRRGVASVCLELGSLAVFLREVAKPPQAVITSPQAVLHDTATGVAAVTNFSTASAFVKSIQ